MARRKLLERVMRGSGTGFFSNSSQDLMEKFLRVHFIFEVVFSVITTGMGSLDLASFCLGWATGVGMVHTEGKVLLPSCSSACLHTLQWQTFLLSNLLSRAQCDMSKLIFQQQVWLALGEIGRIEWLFLLKSLAFVFLRKSRLSHLDSPIYGWNVKILHDFVSFSMNILCPFKSHSVWHFLKKSFNFWQIFQ